MRWWLACILTSPLAAGDPAEFFELRVRPLLAKNCYGCHTGTRMGGLRLDSRAEILKGGNSGPAIVPGDAAHSLLIRAVSQTDERLRMPPQGKLAASEIADLAAWVDAGAIWPEAARVTTAVMFWSFQPVRKPPLPDVKARTPIDRFVAAKLQEHGLKQVLPADRRTLIRRVTFDLTGLPPAPEEVEAFVKDRSPDAFAKVVDRLLASPRYGERWGRYWLDVARYSDDKLDSERDNPYPNSFRYRDWVIQAFNNDMPYDRFVMAQIAGDQIEPSERAALGFYALSPEFQDDRVDATTRGFLGLTVACAQCHDHKFDPIPTRDYYSLLGVFTSSEVEEYPLAQQDVVKAYQEQKKKVDEQKKAIQDFIETESMQLAEILAARTADYMMGEGGLDQETLERWKQYLKSPEKDHPFLKGWFATPARQTAEDFQQLVLAVHAEKKVIDGKNRIKLGLNPDRGALAQADLFSIERDKYVLWNDAFGSRGVLRYTGEKIDRFLAPLAKEHLDRMRARLKELEAALPPQYPFVHALRDRAKPHNERVHIRGSRDNLGEEAPRRFLSALSREAVPFSKGSGRLEMARAIADPGNPLTARVIANRVWLHHFGQGLVRTPSNFGQLGERPSHPELLDYLAARLVENKWSLKALHREILLSDSYQLSAASAPKNSAEDPENRLLWRFNRRRLHAEALRDSLLAVAGNLDLTMGGPATRMTDDFRRRAVYGFVSRRRLDGMFALFDFPNPNSTSEQRMETNVPLQRLFFMNSEFVIRQAEALAKRLTGVTDEAKIREAYLLLYARPATPHEVRLGLEFLRSGTWPQYTQALLASNEFSFVE